MRVLFVKPSSFGDVIHALPVAAALRRFAGVEQLDWVINEDLAEWLKGNPSIDRILPFPRRDRRRLPAFWHSLRSEYYDWVIDLQGLLRSALISRAARAGRRIGMSDAREGAACLYSELAPIRPGHAIDRYLQVLDYLDIPRPHPLEFPLPGGDPEILSAIGPDPFALLHPYSRWPTKELEAPLVQAIVARLLPLRTVIIGRGSGFADSGALDLSNRTDTGGLLTALRKAAVVISTDSGPMHLAAALGKPLVALFGPTSPAKTGPWHPGGQAIQLNLPCAPCFSRTCRNASIRACLRELDPARIAQAANALN